MEIEYNIKYYDIAFAKVTMVQTRYVLPGIKAIGRKSKLAILNKM